MYYFTPHSSMFGTNYVPPHLERFVTSTHDFRCRYSEREVISVPHKNCIIDSFQRYLTIYLMLRREIYQH